MDKQAQIQKLEEEMKQLSAQLSAQHRQLLELRRQLHELNPHAQQTSKKEPAFSLEALRSSSLENLIGLRLIHLIGIVVLVIGLSLGVKYAIDKNLISEELRIALAYAAGALLYALSLWLRKSLPGFSAILFSGGMASLYFTT